MPVQHVSPLTIAAHKGDCYDYPENTMLAYKKAAEAGAHMLEVDVRITKDGELIMMHDDRVDRTTDGKGAVKDMTLAEIKSLRAGDAVLSDSVPTLRELLQWASGIRMPLNIEIKEYWSPENEQRCIKCVEDTLTMVEEFGMGDIILINSFDAFVLEHVHKTHGKKYMLHGFYPYSLMRNVVIDPAEYLYCACIFDDRNKQLYDDLIALGIEPWVGAGVTRKSHLQLCISYGAKLITTNNTEDVLRKIAK